MAKKSGTVSWRSARDERKGTPIFWRHLGSSRQHQCYLAEGTQWTCFWRMGRRCHAKRAQLGSSSLSHHCLPLEDGVMGLLPRHTPNLTAKKTHFFSRKFTADLGKYDSLQLGPWINLCRVLLTTTSTLPVALWFTQTYLVFTYQPCHQSWAVIRRQWIT